MNSKMLKTVHIMLLTKTWQIYVTVRGHGELTDVKYYKLVWKTSEWESVGEGATNEQIESFFRCGFLTSEKVDHQVIK